MIRSSFLIGCCMFLVHENLVGKKGHVPDYAIRKEIVLDNESQPTPKDPFPVEKTFRITSVDDSLLAFAKNDIIKISTRNGLKHYRNKRLLNTYKIIPQLSIIMIQPQCRVAPCPEIESKVVVYYLDSAERFIDIRNKTLSISTTTQQESSTPTKALKLKWKPALRLSLQK